MEAVIKPPEKQLTSSEYLEQERQCIREDNGKYEYHQGELILMGGANKEHNRISMNLSVLIGSMLFNKPYEAFHSDMRTYAPEKDSYYYPDLVVVQGEPSFKDQEFDNLLNPFLIIEIVSPSTSSYDRGDKFLNYRSIATLHEYMIVSSQQMYVECFRKMQNNEWRLTIYEKPQEAVSLLSGEVSLTLEQIYKNVL